MTNCGWQTVAHDWPGHGESSVAKFRPRTATEYSWCRSPSGADSVLDHCSCRGVQNRSGSLGTDVCGWWTSPSLVLRLQNVLWQLFAYSINQSIFLLQCIRQKLLTANATRRLDWQHPLLTQQRIEPQRQQMNPATPSRASSISIANTAFNCIQSHHNAYDYC